MRSIEADLSYSPMSNETQNFVHRIRRRVLPSQLQFRLESGVEYPFQDSPTMNLSPNPLNPINHRQFPQFLSLGTIHIQISSITHSSVMKFSIFYPPSH